MIHNVTQGSEEWEEIRLGKLTASACGEWLVAEPKFSLNMDQSRAELDRLGIQYKKSAKAGELQALLPDAIVIANMGYSKGALKAKRSTMCRMMSAELGGKLVDDWTGNKFTDFGNAYEDEAVREFEIQTGLETEKIGFVTLDGFPYFGCSPDRYVIDDGKPLGVLEVKCKPVEHVETVINGVLPPEHQLQVHFQMAITGLDCAWFFAYSPQMKPLLLKVYADDYTQRVLAGLEKFHVDYEAFRREHLGRLKIGGEA